MKFPKVLTICFLISFVVCCFFENPLYAPTECTPSFTVTKTCITSPWNDGVGPCDLRPGDIARYEITICNTSSCPIAEQELDLNFIVNDEQLGIVDQVVGPIPRGQCVTIQGEETVPPCPMEPNNGNIPLDENIVTVDAFLLTGELLGSEQSSATCCYRCLTLFESCTPGYWKNSPNCWCDSYTPEMLISDVFARLQIAPYDTIDDSGKKRSKSDFDNDTMLDALKYGGGNGLAGSTRNMLRHATAALLNSCNNDLFYPVSDTMVIDLVNFVLDGQDPAMVQDLHIILASWNEDFPCPISSDNSMYPCQRED